MNLKLKFFVVFFLVIFFQVITYAQIKNKKDIESKNIFDIAELSLKLENHSLLVYKDKKISYQDEHGIKPLLIQIKKKGLKDAIVVDKLVGKAAALLMVYGGVKQVHTNIIAKDAMIVFEKYNIKYSANEIVEYIQNRTKDGLCPMEEKVKNIDKPKKAYKIFKKIIKLN